MCHITCCRSTVDGALEKSEIGGMSCERAVNSFSGLNAFFFLPKSDIQLSTKETFSCQHATVAATALTRQLAGEDRQSVTTLGEL